MPIKGFPTATHLSPHFAKSEFACGCGCKMPYDIELMLAELAIYLEQLRDKADAPLHVNSGYRCHAHNRAIGGAQQSYHCRGVAADISCASHSPQQIYLMAESIGRFHAGGIGLYSSWVHVDIRRDGPARWKG